MTVTTKNRASAAVRLRLDPHPSRATVLDGAWWPQSRNVVAELPQLVDALAGLRGEITHVLLNTAEWDLPHPQRVTGGKHAVRLGWFTSQPAGLLTIISDFGRDRFDLFVVPADASAASADTALTATADGGDNHRTPDLLAAIQYRA
jgi:hypothetical protein